MNTLEVTALSQIIGYKDKREVKKQVQQLQDLRWVSKNIKTGYYLIYSFDRIRLNNQWSPRAAIECYPRDLNTVYALTGAAIYSYLHKYFWSRVAREKSVRAMGRTYTALSCYSSIYDNPAPIATTGIESIYDISKASASRLKKQAQKAGYITVKKSVLDITPKNAQIAATAQKYDLLPPGAYIKAGKARLRQIDMILPKIKLNRRRSLKRYSRGL